MANKECPSCKTKCGPRTMKCKQCNYSFIIENLGLDVQPKLDKPEIPKQTKRKRRKKKWTVIHWEDLEFRDMIKVSKGPYYLTREGKKIPMGPSGRLRVISKDENGLVCRDIDYGGMEY